MEEAQSSNFSLVEVLKLNLPLLLKNFISHCLKFKLTVKPEGPSI